MQNTCKSCNRPVHPSAVLCTSCAVYRANGILFAELGFKNVEDIYKVTDEEVDRIIDKYDRELKEAEERSKTEVTPKAIHKRLNDYIIGQEEAKTVISVAAYNHYKKITNDDLGAVKSNILLLGPTGCGKTLIAQRLAKILNVPLVICDATSLTEAGYVGEDVNSMLLKLLNAADKKIDVAEKGIIFLDEVDKLRKPKQERGRDVAGEGVQQSLLRLMEGAKVEVSLGKGMTERSIEMDTSKILFICAGSFSGIEDIIKKRINVKTSIGFGAKVGKTEEDKNILTKVDIEDLTSFGIIPELLGRLPIVTSLEQLEEKDLVRIMTEPKDSIVKQFQDLLKLDNAELKFDKEALKAIAKLAIKNKTGARGLRSLVEKVLTKTMYEIPSLKGNKTIEVSKVNVEKGTSPKVKLKK